MVNLKEGLDVAVGTPKQQRIHLSIPKTKKARGLILLIVLVAFVGGAGAVYQLAIKQNPKDQTLTQEEIKAKLRSTSPSEVTAEPTFTSKGSSESSVVSSPTGRSTQTDPNPPTEKPKSAP